MENFLYVQVKLCQKTLPFFAILLLALFSLTISSCIPLESVSPLGKNQSSKVDENLLGIWCKTVEFESELYLAILEREDNYLKVLYFDNSDELCMELRGYATIIDEESFLNLQLVGIDSTNFEQMVDSTYYIFHYQINVIMSSKYHSSIMSSSGKQSKMRE